MQLRTSFEDENLRGDRILAKNRGTAFTPKIGSTRIQVMLDYARSHRLNDSIIMKHIYYGRIRLQLPQYPSIQAQE